MCKKTRINIKPFPPKDLFPFYMSVHQYNYIMLKTIFFVPTKSILFEYSGIFRIKMEDNEQQTELNDVQIFLRIKVQPNNTLF